MVSNTFCTISGASPIDGSSSSSSFGRDISARPIASICCSPPDIVPAVCRRRSFSRGKSAKTRSTSLAHRRAVAADVRAHREVLLDRQRAEHAAALGHHREALADQPDAAACR